MNEQLHGKGNEEKGSKKDANEMLGVIEEVTQRLVWLNEAAQMIPQSMAELMAWSKQPVCEILQAATDDTVRETLFTEEVMYSGGLASGMPRLRMLENGHWAQVFAGAASNEVSEVYNYLQLVRIPKVGFRILEAMGNLPLKEVGALEGEAKQLFFKMDELAFQALKNSEKVLGLDQMAALMSVDRDRVLKHLKEK